MKIPTSVVSYIPLRHYYAIKRPSSLKTNEIQMFRPEVDRYGNNRRRTRFFLKSSGEKYKFNRKIAPRLLVQITSTRKKEKNFPRARLILQKKVCQSHEIVVDTRYVIVINVQTAGHQRVVQRND